MGKGSGNCSRPSLPIEMLGEASDPAEAPLSLVGKIPDTVEEFNQLIAADDRYVAIQARREMQWIEEDEMNRFFAESTARELELHPLTALRLERQGLEGADYENYRRYLNPSRQDIRSAEDTVEGMEKAASRCQELIDEGATIAVFGDYDVDGNTAGAVTGKALRAAGARDEQLFIDYASASSGFGLTHAFVDQASEHNARMLITVDCGSSQNQAISYAQKHGIEVVVIDHHNVEMDNPAEHHLNPRFPQGLEHQYGMALRASASKNGRQLTSVRKKLKNDPDDAELIETEMTLLDERDDLKKALIAFTDESPFEIENIEHASERAKRKTDKMMDADLGTGAQLAWKFGGELLRQKEGEIPDWWYGQPLYLSSLGAVADRADMCDIENRAFVRVPLEAREECVPIGVQVLAEMMEEDPRKASSMIRTRAALNLPKRTSKVQASDVARLYESKTREEAQQKASLLAQAHAESSTAREEMEALVQKYRADWVAQAKASKKLQSPRYWVHAIVNEEKYESYVGQAGILAPKLAKEYKLPAVVFTRQGRDADGEVIFKWSARNNQVRTQIGGLLAPKYKNPLQNACVLAHKMEDGSVERRGSVGGHGDVISGSCRESEIKQVLGVMNKFGQDQSNKSGGFWQASQSNRVYCQERKVNPKDLDRLDREATLIEPACNNNYQLRVSVEGRIRDLGPVDPDRKAAKGILEMDGVSRPVLVEQELSEIVGADRWEFAISPGDDTYYLKQARPVD